ncbi:hypothetical protein [Rathayibacter sp. VKM Ac-2754]|uniref:hypothetical protein n=1 Tax=Rathayibacter sp. VKM Ac-2754 TaxID=2609251 RepID=UPI001359D652|nr:hypothetical protein [Rathayibacter sp. VKM Ac-2754]MWV58624.1 hypothetical protein [Rathayibacter sp. VKM Ac-2754]
MAESTETSARTDPRFHAAYQRGYDGPEPERLTRAEERFRRPRRGEAEEERRRQEPPAEAPRIPERWREVRVPPESSEPLPAPELPAPEPEPELEERAETDRARPSAASRTAIALAVMGALFLVVGAATLWTANASAYYDTVTGPEQFFRAVLMYVPGPGITIGLLSIGGAITLKAARS